MKRLSSIVLALILPLSAFAQEAAIDPLPLFKEHCAECHGKERLGGMGPALIPDNLGRLRKPEAAKVVAEGRALTQMPAFADKLDPREIAALVDYAFSPLKETPRFTAEDIAANHTVETALLDRPPGPTYAADPLNLFVVVEQGDSHATLLDGDKLEPIHRFPTRFALHGGPKFSPDGRFVYFASRDGWITKYDLHALEVVAETRAGINTRNLAISGDGRTVMVGNYLPHTVVLLDARDLSLIRLIEAKDRKGEQSSRVSAVYQARPRNSFIVALKDIPELWEISWLDDPPPVYSGLVHSWEKGMVEGLAAKGRFPIRRILLSQPLDDFFFDPPYYNVLGSGRDAGKATVVNLIVGREIAEVALSGLPHLGSGITWEHGGRAFMATPNLREGAISVIDMKDWKLVGRIETLGPGFFLRSHENTNHAWVDSSFSKAKDTMQVIDKTTFQTVARLTPQPGTTTFHTEFTRDGRYALVSVAEPEGALVIYDAHTFQEVKRIPMRKPSGKYNVWNKITLSSGTSH